MRTLTLSRVRAVTRHCETATSLQGLPHVQQHISTFLFDPYAWTLTQVVANCHQSHGKSLLRQLTDQRFGKFHDGDDIKRAFQLAIEHNHVMAMEILVDFYRWLLVQGYSWVFEVRPTSGWREEPKCETPGFHPFEYAAKVGQMELVQWFCRNHRDLCMPSALQMAALSGHFAIVAFLVHQQVVSPKEAQEMAELAITEDQLAVVKCLAHHRLITCRDCVVEAGLRRGRIQAVAWAQLNLVDDVCITTRVCSKPHMFKKKLDSNRFPGIDWDAQRADEVPRDSLVQYSAHFPAIQCDHQLIMDAVHHESWDMLVWLRPRLVCECHAQDDNEESVGVELADVSSIGPMSCRRSVHRVCDCIKHSFDRAVMAACARGAIRAVLFVLSHFASDLPSHTLAAVVNGNTPATQGFPELARQRAAERLRDGDFDVVRRVFDLGLLDCVKCLIEACWRDEDLVAMAWLVNNLLHRSSPFLWHCSRDHCVSAKLAINKFLPVRSRYYTQGTQQHQLFLECFPKTRVEHQLVLEAARRNDAEEIQWLLAHLNCECADEHANVCTGGKCACVSNTIDRAFALACETGKDAVVKFFLANHPEKSRIFGENDGGISDRPHASDEDPARRTGLGYDPESDPQLAVLHTLRTSNATLASAWHDMMQSDAAPIERKQVGERLVPLIGQKTKAMESWPEVCPQERFDLSHPPIPLVDVIEMCTGFRQEIQRLEPIEMRNQQRKKALDERNSALTEEVLSAVRARDLTKLSKLTAQGTQIYSPQAMDSAAGCGFLGIVRFLETRRSEQVMHRSPTAIHEAAQEGYLQVVEFLVQKGYTCDDRAIDLAAANGHVRVVELLLRVCPPSHRTDNEWLSPTCGGHLEALKILFYNTPGPGNRQRDVWREALLRGYLDILKWIVENNGSLSFAVRTAIDIVDSWEYVHTTRHEPYESNPTLRQRVLQFLEDLKRQVGHE